MFTISFHLSWHILLSCFCYLFLPWVFMTLVSLLMTFIGVHVHRFDGDGTIFLHLLSMIINFDLGTLSSASLKSIQRNSFETKIKITSVFPRLPKYLLLTKHFFKYYYQSKIIWDFKPLFSYLSPYSKMFSYFLSWQLHLRLAKVSQASTVLKKKIKNTNNTKEEEERNYLF